MGGEAVIHVFRQGFVIGVGGTVPIFEHGESPRFVADPGVLIGEFETAFRRLAVEPFCPCPFLNDLPGSLKAKFKTLDGGVSGEISFRSTECFAETHDGCGKAVEPGRHKRIP